MQDITSVTPTICKLMNIKQPAGSNVNVIESLIAKAQAENISKIDKCLIFAPDAIGVHLYNKYSRLFDKVHESAPVRVPLYSMIPPKTPVCFASMFTGLTPQCHGINCYSKPVLKCDTIFDALIRADKKVAIVAVVNSSIDMIFRGRNIAYFSEDYDPQVTKKVIELLKADEHDVIVAYHQEYDDTLHKTELYSKDAIEALKNHINSFAKIADFFDRCWL